MADALAKVRALAAADWGLLRELRLAALTQDAYAFGSTVERETQRTPEQWRQLCDSSAWFAAESDRELVGIACGSPGSASRPRQFELYSMWVALSVRGTGVSGSLLAEIVKWAREKDATELHLLVAEDNFRAIHFYERSGFVPSGDREPLRSNLEIMTIGMSLRL